MEWRTLEKDWKWTGGGLQVDSMDYIWTGGGLHKDPWGSVRYSDNSTKVILFECIPDCLGCDRIRKDVVDEMGGLHSIIKSSSGDLTNNRSLVT